MPGPLPIDVATHYPHGYALVDVETTGLSAVHHRVLQIAVVQMRSDGGLESSWSTLLDPGCDPGPVHVHGLTRQKLAGSPLFSDVAAELAALLAGRVFVAHNARFDWDFIATEGARAGAGPFVTNRLCTIALSRRLDVPAASMSLESVAAYWGVPQVRAHDAMDDTRVLIEILRHSLALAHRVNATLPLTPCTASSDRTIRPVAAPRPPCLWRYPGRWSPRLALQQGMKIVFTGDTRSPREALTRQAARAGLDVMNSVSSRTSVLVRNPTSAPTRKSELAYRHSTPVVTEADFELLLTQVAAGHARTPANARPAGSALPVTALVVPAPQPSGPLVGRRVLILGGTHEEAAHLRSRVAELGGQGAANLTAAVTDLVVMPGGQGDPRCARAKVLGLPLLNPVTLAPLPHHNGDANGPAIAYVRLDCAPDAPVAVVLPRGGVTDLPADIDGWSLSTAWTDQSASVDVNVVAFVVDADDQVLNDSDFCFYNQPEHPSGCIELELDTPNEMLANLRPSQLPSDRRRLVIAAAVGEGHTFGDLGPIELVLRTAAGAPVMRATLDAATKERSMLLANIYERNGVWRVRAVGQGYEADLAGLSVMHGVDIEES